MDCANPYSAYNNVCDLLHKTPPCLHILQEFCLQVVLLLVVTTTSVMGRSSGAPSAACATITPGHGTSTATGPVPFIVNISSLDGGYVPGQSYTS